MRHRTLRLLTTLAWLALVPVPAMALPSDSLADHFKLRVVDEPSGKVVQVEFRHPVFGWVEAGAVTFLNSGKIVLAIRGEQETVITDLCSTLSLFSEKKVGDPTIGRELALNIEQMASSQ